MRKKLVSSMLCMAMAATMLAGCGGSGNAENTQAATTGCYRGSNRGCNRSCNGGSIQKPHRIPLRQAISRLRYSGTRKVMFI